MLQNSIVGATSSIHRRQQRQEDIEEQSIIVSSRRTTRMHRRQRRHRETDIRRVRTDTGVIAQAHFTAVHQRHDAIGSDQLVASSIHAVVNRFQWGTGAKVHKLGSLPKPASASISSIVSENTIPAAPDGSLNGEIPTLVEGFPSFSSLNGFAITNSVTPNNNIATTRISQGTPSGIVAPGSAKPQLCAAQGHRQSESALSDGFDTDQSATIKTITAQTDCSSVNNAMESTGTLRFGFGEERSTKHTRSEKMESIHQEEESLVNSGTGISTPLLEKQADGGALHGITTSSMGAPSTTSLAQQASDGEHPQANTRRHLDTDPLSIVQQSGGTSKTSVSTTEMEEMPTGSEPSSSTTEKILEAPGEDVTGAADTRNTDAKHQHEDTEVQHDRVPLTPPRDQEAEDHHDEREVPQLSLNAEASTSAIRRMQNREESGYQPSHGTGEEQQHVRRACFDKNHSENVKQLVRGSEQLCSPHRDVNGNELASLEEEHQDRQQKDLIAHGSRSVATTALIAIHNAVSKEDDLSTDQERLHVNHNDTKKLRRSATQKKTPRSNEACHDNIVEGFEATKSSRKEERIHDNNRSRSSQKSDTNPLVATEHSQKQEQCTFYAFIVSTKRRNGSMSVRNAITEIHPEVTKSEFDDFTSFVLKDTDRLITFPVQQPRAPLGIKVHLKDLPLSTSGLEVSQPLEIGPSLVHIPQAVVDGKSTSKEEEVFVKRLRSSRPATDSSEKKIRHSSTRKTRKDKSKSDLKTSNVEDQLSSIQESTSSAKKPTNPRQDSLFELPPLEQFTGQGDINVFFRKFKDINMALNLRDPRKQLNLLLTKLSDHARDHAEDIINDNADSTLEDVIKGLRRRFMPPSQQLKAKEALKDCKKLTEESVGDFYDRARRLAKQAHEDNDAVVQHVTLDTFIHGLPTMSRLILQYHQPKSPQDALKVALDIEPVVDQEQKRNEALEAEVKQLKEMLVKMLQHSSLTSPTETRSLSVNNTIVTSPESNTARDHPRRRGLCDYCRIRGHYRIECATRVEDEKNGIFRNSMVARKMKSKSQLNDQVADSMSMRSQPNNQSLQVRGSQLGSQHNQPVISTQRSSASPNKDTSDNSDASRNVVINNSALVGQ